MKRSIKIRLIGVLAGCLAVLSGRDFLNSQGIEKATLGSLTFEHRVIDATPPSGSNCCLDIIAVGNIDDDHKPDIMVGSQNSIGAVWYHAPSWKRYLIGVGEFTTDGEIADLDQDGDGDIVLSNYGQNTIDWWENTGNPFHPSGWVRHVVSSRFAHDVAVGDVNGDRDLDVITFRKDEPKQLTWFEAPANPRKSWTRHEIDTPPGEGLDLGDIDADGDLDIAAGPNWYENQHRQTWKKHPLTAVVAIAGKTLTPWGTETRDVIADLNRDGKLDILLSHAEGDGRVSWFENPAWTEHVIEPTSLKGAHSLDVADFDGDRDLDVFVGEMNTGGGNVMVYENHEQAKRWQRNILATTGTHNAIAADIDADGVAELVGKNYTGQKVVEAWKVIHRAPLKQSLSRSTPFPAIGALNSS